MISSTFRAVPATALLASSGTALSQSAQTTLLNVSYVDAFGGWQQAQKQHFDDGGIFDRVIAATGKK